MKLPRVAQGTHVPAPIWDPCPLSVLPGAQGTLSPYRGPSPLTGQLCKVREVMMAVGAVTFRIGAALMAGPTGGQRDPPVLMGKGQGSQ